MAEEKSEARLKNGEMAANALRVVAVAFREWDEEPLFFTAEELERDLVFAGMAGMMDPPRPEAQAAVEICQKGRDSSCDDYGRSCADSTGDCRRAWDLPCRGIPC